MIAIDGKVLRRSHDKGIDKAAIDMVSAWATANHLVLGQVKVDEKSNEITAIPQLLEALEVSGCIVTIDAMGCQTDIAEKIIDREAEYVLALKENQGNLYEDVEHLFADLEDSQYKAYAFDYEKTVNKDHGRIEIRECWTISDPEVLRHLRGFANWKNLAHGVPHPCSALDRRRKELRRPLSYRQYHRSQASSVGRAFALGHRE